MSCVLCIGLRVSRCGEAEQIWLEIGWPARGFHGSDGNKVERVRASVSRARQELARCFSEPGGEAVTEVVLKSQWEIGLMQEKKKKNPSWELAAVLAQILLGPVHQDALGCSAP